MTGDKKSVVINLIIIKCVDLSPSVSGAFVVVSSLSMVSTKLDVLRKFKCRKNMFKYSRLGDSLMGGQVSTSMRKNVSNLWFLNWHQYLPP